MTQTRIVILGGGCGGCGGIQAGKNQRHTFTAELHEVLGARVEPKAVTISFLKIFGAKRVTGGRLQRQDAPCSFHTPDADKVRRLGAAIEMLHMATLVHDDIIDFEGSGTETGLSPPSWCENRIPPMPSRASSGESGSARS